MRDILDSPLIFIVVTTLLVLAVAHLMHAGATRLGWQGLQEFTSLPD